ncbi:MAG: ADP-ribosylation factor-like protein [Candidatus Odinarchaeota archaeon]
MEDGWVSKGERSSRLGHKILIAGLSEAGKTAVKRVFFMKQKAEDVDNLDATINYERMAFNISDVPVTIIDLGGQRVFIKRFLSGFSPFIFSSVKIFLFVLDVSIRSTRNNAIQYFASCLEKLKKYSPDAKFFVFLHKNDLVRHLPNYESTHAQLKEQFQLESPEKIHFFRTTIYKPETVIDGFGRMFEIAIPSIAKSKYVNGRTIGQVEEFAESAVVTSQVEVGYCPKCGSEFINSGDYLLCNFCGHKQLLTRAEAGTHDSADSSSGALEKLLGLMKDSLPNDQIPEDTAREKSPVVPASAGADALAKIQGLMKQPPDKKEVPEDIAREKSPVVPVNAGADALAKIQGLMKQPPDKKEVPEDIAREKSPVVPVSAGADALAKPEEEIDEKVVEIAQPPDNVTFEFPEDTETDLTDGSIFQIEYIKDFYGIKEGDAMKLVGTGYVGTFETGAQAGVPIPILIRVLLQYVPYLIKKDIISENPENRILDVLLAHLGGIVRENELFHCLIYAFKKPEKSIEEITKNYILRQRTEKKKELREVLRAKPKEVEPEREIIPAKIDKDIIQLSESNAIGFKAEQEKDNCRLIFFHGNNPVYNSLIPKTISSKELAYLLAFEADLPIEGNFNDFVEIAVPVIHKTVTKLFNFDVSDPEEPPAAEESQKTENSQLNSIDSHKKKSIVKAESNYRYSVPVREDQHVTFTIEANDEFNQVTFEMNEQEICLITVPSSITSSDFLETIRNETLLSVIASEDDLNTLTQVVFLALQTFRKKKEFQTPKQDETAKGDSDKLESYLRNLQEDQ